MSDPHTRTTRSRGRQVRAKQSHTGRWVAVGVVLLIAASAAIFVFLGSQATASIEEQFRVTTAGQPIATLAPDTTLPGTAMTDEGAGHVLEGQDVTYISEPPTSGSHWGRQAEWGIYEAAPPDERLVHNLEHGGIIFWYHPDQLSNDELGQLQELTRELSQQNARIILTPRESLDAPVAASAWGYLLKLESFDLQALREFYQAHIGRGPECSPPGVCPG